MIIKKTQTIFFSPTNTSKQIAKAIVQGVGLESAGDIDVTLKAIPETVIASSVLAVVVVPVYGGHVAPIALKRIRSIRGSNTPTVIVVVYGNRTYEKALIELDLLLTQQGFNVVAGATFIGEHSYSSLDTPIASGRPNLEDCQKAVRFGEEIARKIVSIDSLENLSRVDVRRISRPSQPIFPMLRFVKKVISLKRSGLPIAKTPWVEEESLCTHCGRCVKNCPVQAIDLGDELHTNPSVCLKCCACVKGCPQQARVYRTPFAELLSQCFTKEKQPQTIL